MPANQKFDHLYFNAFWMEIVSKFLECALDEPKRNILISLF